MAASDWEEVPAAKAAQGDWEEVPSGPSAPQGYKSPGGDSVGSRLSDPNRWKAILSGQGPAAQKVVGDDMGAAGLAIPMESAPAGLAKLASYLSGSGVGPALGRIGANSAVGAIQGAPSGNAKTGALVGAAGGAAGEVLARPLAALGKMVGTGLSRLTPPQVQAYLSDLPSVGQFIRSAEDDPEIAQSGGQGIIKKMVGSLQDQTQMPDLQNQAAEAIQNSRTALRGQGLNNASQLSDLLKDKSLSLDPARYSGIDPRIDEVLSKAQGSVSQGPQDAFKDLASRGPKPIDVNANDANTIKRILQEKANFNQGTMMDPVQAAKNAEMAQKAQSLRGQIEQVGGDGVSELNKTMQQGTLMNSALRKGLKSPLSFISTEAPDRVATLAGAENAGAGGLLDFGNKLGAAKNIASKDTGSGIPTFTGKLAGRSLLRLSDALKNAADGSPLVTQNILKSMFSDESNK